MTSAPDRDVPPPGRASGNAESPGEYDANAAYERPVGVTGLRLRDGLEPENIRSLRARLEVFRQREQLAIEVRSTVAAALPSALSCVVRTFYPPRVFIQAVIDYVEPGADHPIDVAWPAKKIAIRVNNLPRIGHRYLAPVSVYTDALLREREWLILPIDPDGPACAEQLRWALLVVQRFGVYRR